MKIFDLRCPNCHAIFKVAESDLLGGGSHALVCAGCGTTLAKFEEPKARVSRLVVTGDHKRFFAPSIVP